MRILWMIGRAWHLLAVRGRRHAGHAHPPTCPPSHPPAPRTTGDPYDDADARRDRVGNSWLIPRG